MVESGASWWGLCLLSVALSACVPSESPDYGAQLQPELDKLVAQLDQTHARLDAIDAKLDAIDAKLDKKLTAPAAPTPAELPVASYTSSADEPPELEGLRCSAQRCTIARDQWNKLVEAPESVAKMVRIVPAVRDGQSAGFKLYGIRPDSFPRQLGFKNGDMITAISGLPLRSVEDLDAVLALLEKASEIVIDFESRDSPKQLTLVIEEGE